MGEKNGSQRQIPAEVVRGMLHGEREPKTRRMEVRLSESQVAALDYIADQLGITTSEVVRRSVFAAERLGQMATRREWELAGDYVAYRNAVYDLKAELARARVDMNRAGNNVNQVARHLNGGSGLSRVEVAALCSQFGAVGSRLRSLDEKADRLLECREALRPLGGE